MKANYALKPLLAMFMLLALAFPLQATTLTENFNSSSASNNTYSSGTNFSSSYSSDYDFSGWSATNAYVGKNVIRLSTGSKNGTLTNNGSFLENVSLDGQFTVKVWAATWNNDNAKLSVIYNGETQTITPIAKITDTNATYNASDFTASIDFTFTKGESNEIEFSAVKRVLIDKIQVEYEGVPIGVMEVSPETMSFEANIGEISEAQSATLTLTDVDAATVTYDVTSNVFSVTKESDTQYNVVFNAPAEAGYYDATLTFTSSQDNVKPVSVALSGRSVDPNEKAENFHSLTVASGVSYNTSYSFRTDGYDYDGWVAVSRVNSGDEFVKMGANGNGGVLSNSGNFLEQIPVGTEFTVQVWCAVWGSDNKGLTVSYGGNDKPMDVNVSIESPHEKSYNAADFTASTDFTFVKGSSNEIKFTSAERLIIDKIALSYDGGTGSTAYMEASVYKLSFTANMGTYSAAQNVTLTLSGVEASTVSYTVDNEDFIVTPVNETEYSVIYKASPVKGSYNGTLTFSSTQEGIAPVAVSLEGTSENPFANSGDLAVLSSVDEISASDTYYMAVEYNGEYKIVESISETSSGYFAVIASQTLQTTNARFTIAPMEGGYSIYFDDGTYQGYVSPNNDNNVSLSTEAKPWNISYADGYFNIEAIGTNDVRQMAYNNLGVDDRIAPYKSSVVSSSSYSTKVVLFKFASTFEVFPANGTEISEKPLTSRMYVQFDEQPQMAEASLIWVNAIPESDAVANMTLASVPVASDYEMIATVDAANNRVYFKPNTWDTCLPLGVRYRVIFQENAVSYSGSASPAFGWEFNTVMPSGVEDAVAATGLSYDGNAVVSRDGNAVEVYNLAGVLVARSNNGRVVMQGLADGIYVARSGKEVLKLVKR